jgi:hypothetical protein
MSNSDKESLIVNSIDCINKYQYINRTPFPYWYIDNFLIDNIAENIKN